MVYRLSSQKRWITTKQFQPVTHYSSFIYSFFVVVAHFAFRFSFSPWPNPAKSKYKVHSNHFHWVLFHNSCIFQVHFSSEDERKTGPTRKSTKNIYPRPVNMAENEEKIRQNKKELKSKRVFRNKKRKMTQRNSYYHWKLGTATGWNGEARLTVKLKSSLNHSSKWTYFFFLHLIEGY